MTTIAQAAVKITGNTSDFEAATQRTGQGLQQLSSQVGSSSKEFFAFAGNLAAAYAGIHAVASAIHTGIDEMLKTEKFTTQLGIMTGSAEDATHALEAFESRALQLSINPTQFVAAAKQLMLFGASAGQASDMVAQLANISAVTDTPIAQLADTVGRVLMEGKVESRTLRTLRQDMPMVLRELQVMFGVTDDKFREMVTSGEVSANDFMKALERLAGAQGKYGDATLKMAGTVGGAWDSVKDNFGEFMESVGNQIVGGGQGAFASWLDRLATGFNVLRMGADKPGGMLGAAEMLINDPNKWYETYGKTEQDKIDSIRVRKDLLKQTEESETKAAEAAKEHANTIQQTISFMRQYRSAADSVRDSLVNLEVVYAQGVMTENEYAQASQAIKDKMIDQLGVLSPLEQAYAKANKQAQDAFAAMKAGLITEQEFEKAYQNINSNFQKMTPWGQMQEDLARFTEELEHQAMTFGMTANEAKLFDLAMRGASKSELQAAKDMAAFLNEQEKFKKLKDDVKNMMEQIRTPFEDFIDTLEKLRQAREKGLITEEQYSQAMGAAAINATKGMNAGKQFAGAALAGSQEAYSAILQQQSNKSVSPLERIKQLEEKAQADRKRQIKVGEEIRDAVKNNQITKVRIK